MPAPGSEVNVQDFIFSIPRIELKLDFGNSIESNAFQESPPRSLYDWLVSCLHKCTIVAEFYWILAPALSHQRGTYAPLLADRTERELILSPSGNTLLEENLLRRNMTVHLCESSSQFSPVVGGESFDVRQGKEMMIDSGFQDYWVRDTFCFNVGKRIADGGPGNRNSQFFRPFMGQPLIQSKLGDFDRRRRHPVNRTQGFAVSRDDLDILVIAGKQHPAVKPMLAS